MNITRRSWLGSTCAFAASWFGISKVKAEEVKSCNPKNLPALVFEAEGMGNAHDLLKDVVFVFGHRRQRMKNVWLNEADAMKLSNYGIVDYWGEVRIVEEQLPKGYNKSGWYYGWIEKTNESFSIKPPRPTSNWCGNDFDSLEKTVML
jgi:hypothetical protein